jgi:predicted TIM-barrel fold metal-dependent hydrolase
MVSTETGATDPDDPTLRNIYRACGEAGVPFVKIGYWRWQPG